MTDQTNEHYQKVAQACEELVRAGEKVTADKVLAKVGGSKSTVVKYLRQWRDKSEQQQNLMAEELGFSPEFIQAFNRETYRYTTETKKRFMDLLEQAKDAESFAITALQESEDEKADLKLEVESLKKQLKTVDEKQKIEEAKRTTELNQIHSLLDEKDHDLKEALASRDNALKEQAKFEIRIEDNDKLAARHVAEKQQADAEISELRGSLSQALTDVARLQAELSASRDKESLQAENSKDLSKVVSGLEGKLESQQKEHQTEIKALRSEYDNQVAALNDKHDVQIAGAQEQLAQVRTEYDRHLAELSEKHDAQVAGVQDQLAQARTEYDKHVAALNEKHDAQVSELQDKVVGLTEKSASLAEQIKRSK